MDYKEWFDKLCETHEREMKQAELRGYARGFQQGLESDAVPKPCNGPKYDDWELGDFIMQIMQEFCEMVDEYKAFRRGDQGAIDRFAYECTDLITATVSAMEHSDAAAKHRLDMLVKALRKVQAYCAEHPRGCRGCALLNLWGGCKLGSCPADWDLDDVGAFVEVTSTSGKGGSKP